MIRTRSMYTLYTPTTARHCTAHLCSSLKRREGAEEGAAARADQRRAHDGGGPGGNEATPPRHASG
eukprot:8058497-Pyramimonas_sp.AAC.1